MGDVAFVAPTDSWTQCYNDSWKGIITEAAFAHPAKFSKGLIFKIVQHAIAAGWLQPGDTVVDPFGGVALGGLPCALQGVRWIGLELEPHFHALSLDNIALWHRRYGALAQWVAPVILQGDSRFLQDVISQAALCVSSPPYANGLGKEETYADQSKREKDSHRRIMREKGIADPYYGQDPAQLGNMTSGSISAAIASPPYADRCANDNQRTIAREGLKQGHNEGDGATYGTAPGNLSTLPAGTVAYGQHPAQLGNLPPGSVSDCVISSPPYGDGQVGTGKEGRTGWRGYTDHGGGTGATPGQMAAMPTLPVDLTISSPPYASGCAHTGGVDPHPQYIQGGTVHQVVYGESTGQLASLPEGQIEACVSSPPYEASIHNGNGINASKLTGNTPGPNSQHKAEGYGETQNNLGNTQGGTFWEAALAVVSQTFAILKPGGVAIWVLKSYVRDGHLVDFPADWQRLCQSVGFVTLHEDHAMLVDAPSAPGLFGEDVTYYRIERKSFFRRLAERKGSPAIDFEVVLCMHKPLQAEPLPPDEAWKQGPLVDGYDGVVASPPYAGTPIAACEGNISGKPGGRLASALTDVNGNIKAVGYGSTTGQLSSLPAGQPPTRED